MSGKKDADIPGKRILVRGKNLPYPMEIRGTWEKWITETKVPFFQFRGGRSTLEYAISGATKGKAGRDDPASLLTPQTHAGYIPAL